MLIIEENFKTCIAFIDRKLYYKADANKLLISTSLGWVGFLRYERFTKSGNVILSSYFKIYESQYNTSVNQKRGNEYEHTFYPSMVLAVEKQL